MILRSLATLHTVEFAGFYLPALLLRAAAAIIPFAVIRWLFERMGLYHWLWHRPLFNLALYVLLIGGIVFLGSPEWQ